MNEIRNLKNDVRTEYQEKRKLIPVKEKKMKDEKIAAYFTNSVSFRHADIILIYCSKTEEVDTMEIIKYALSHGKYVACPVSEKETNTLSFRIINSLGDLREGTYGILEPLPSCMEYYEFVKNFKNKNPLSLCVSPGIVYDREGFRIGYGKGYYDRFLSKFAGSKIGFCYLDFLIPKLPHGKYDVKSDVLITEKGIFVPAQG